MTTIADNRLRIEHHDLEEVINALKGESYAVVGSTALQNAIAYDFIESVDDLPLGWTDEQSEVSGPGARLSAHAPFWRDGLDALELGVRHAHASAGSRSGVTDQPPFGNCQPDDIKVGEF